MLPKNKSNANANTNSADPAEKPTFRRNAEVDAKIDAHIKENPEHWNWLQALPRERLELMLILNEVRQLERQQHFKKSILDRVEADPARKQAYDILMKEVPEEQRGDLITTLERRKWRANQSQSQSQTRRQIPAVRV